MQITVWSVAADDDNGTYASVHETESAAYRRLIQLTVDADNKDDVAKAEAFMEAEDFDGLDEWIHEEVIEPLNTYSVDQHKIDVPTISPPCSTEMTSTPRVPETRNTERNLCKSQFGVWQRTTTTAPMPASTKQRAPHTGA